VKRPGDAVPNHLLRNAREYRGWTQEELAEKIGTTSVTISRWESGVTFPSRYFRKKLSILYGQSIQELGLLPVDGAGQPRTVLPPSTPAFPLVAEQSSRLRSGSVFLFNEAL